MKKAVVLMQERLDLSERFRVELQVLRIAANPQHPQGIKVSFVLIDAELGAPRLLIDNHAPFGFHVHTDLPKRKEARRALETTDYREALDEFWRLVKEITRNES